MRYGLAVTLGVLLAVTDVWHMLLWCLVRRRHRLMLLMLLMLLLVLLVVLLMLVLLLMMGWASLVSDRHRGMVGLCGRRGMGWWLRRRVSWRRGVAGHVGSPMRVLKRGAWRRMLDRSGHCQCRLLLLLLLMMELLLRLELVRLLQALL